MAPPNTPENPTPEQKRSEQIRTLFEKARTHKNFQNARKSAQEITTVTLLGESDEEQQVEIIFKEHYASAKYTTAKDKPEIEAGKTHMLLGNVDSDAFDSNYDYGPDYYQDLKFNAMLFAELKDYIDINFPALKDPTQKNRMLEMIDKARFLGNALNIKSFKEFCTQKGFKKAEVFGKHGLLQVLLAFSRAIEPVEDRNLLKVENFKITEENPNPLFYRIELGIGNTGKNKKDRFSIVLKTTLDGETVEPDEEPEESDPDEDDKGTYDEKDADKLEAPPAEEENPEEPASEPPVPATPPVTPTEPAAPTVPVDPAALAKDPAATPPAPDKPADTPAPTAGLKTEQHDIKIDNVDAKLETNAPEGFKFALEVINQAENSYAIKVSLPDKDTPEDPAKAKTGIIIFGKNTDYKASDPTNGHQFWYSFSSTPAAASNLDIWKFYKLQTDATKPSITISKLATKIAVPSINYDEASKQITIFPVADIGKRKIYAIDDQSDQNLKFKYFNDNGTQYLRVTTQDGNREGYLNIEADNEEPVIPTTDATNYLTDIFQHYSFKITKGTGTAPGTIEITEAPKAIKETTLSCEIALDSATPDNKTGFDITIKAPENQTRDVEETDAGEYKVQFGGLTGFFKIEKPNDSSPFVINFQNYPDSGEPNETASSTQDLWSNYKATLDFATKTITIEKLEKKPLPRLEYDEKTGMVTFYEEINNNEEPTSYKINKPDDVEIQYRHESYYGNETYKLEFLKGKGLTHLHPDKSLSSFGNSEYNLWTTHNISFNDTAEPKTINITAISDTVHPDVPRILFDETNYNKATGQGTFGVHFTDGHKQSYTLALPANTETDYLFSEGSNSLVLNNDTIFKEKGTNPGQTQLDFDINFNGTNEIPSIVESIIKDTHSYNFNSDTKTLTISEKDKVIELPSTPPPAPPTPAPADPAPVPATPPSEPSAPGMGSTAAPQHLNAPAASPSDSTTIKLNKQQYIFKGWAAWTQDSKQIMFEPTDSSLKKEMFFLLPKGATFEIQDAQGNKQDNVTLHIKNTGNEYTVEIKLAIIKDIAVSKEKDKITITLDNNTTKDFTLKLPESYKDKIGFEIKQNSNDNNKPYLAVYWNNDNTQHQGFIQLPDNISIKSIKYDNWPNGASEIKPFFSGLSTDTDAPFSLKFESGDNKTLPTITIISNEKVRDTEQAVEKAKAKLKEINTKLDENLYYYSKAFRSLYVNTRINDLKECQLYEPADSNEVNAINNLQINEIDISTAAKALPDWQQEALDEILIQAGKETEPVPTSNDKFAATIAYDKLGNQADIMDELKKIIGFYFHTWDAKDAEALKLEKIKTFKSENIGEKYGNFYSSSTFQSGRLNRYEPKEGDYYAIILPMPKMAAYDSPWYKIWETDGYTFEGSKRAVAAIYKFEKGRWKLIIGKDTKSSSEPEDVEFE